ncbi:MAG: response regulator, partial [Steroidobacter sp.]
MTGFTPDYFEQSNYRLMSQPLSQPDSTATADAPKWRVLLTDDEPVQRMLIGRLLMRAGYEVVMAEDGQQAVQMMQQGEYC